MGSITISPSLPVSVPYYTSRALKAVVSAELKGFGLMALHKHHNMLFVQCNEKYQIHIDVHDLILGEEFYGCWGFIPI